MINQLSRKFIPILMLAWILNISVAYAADFPGISEMQNNETNFNFSDNTSTDFSKGPLFGKNLFAPFLIHYNFPSLPARSGERFDLNYHISMYYVQDNRFDLEKMPSYTERQYDKEYILIDYESWVAELGFSYNVLDNVQVGLDMRILSYYGGFLDSFIEGFHRFFWFSNGGRELFLQNQLYVNIPNENGITFFLDEPVTSFGDIDLWGKWTFFENNKISLAALGAFKLPTGRLSALSGSDAADAALGVLMDFRASDYVSLYAQAGIVMPFNGKSYPMVNGLFGLEIHPWDFLSFNAQLNFKTSPISDNTVGFSWNYLLGTNFKQYSLPQTNALIGIVIHHGDFRWQFYIEEDPITNQGNDIVFNITFSHTINLKKKGLIP